MPKSILEVDVNTEQFKEFQTLFEKYQSQVQKLPGAWGNINKEVKSGFEAATAALLAQSELNRRTQQANKEQANQAKEQSSYWKSTASSTAAVANNLYRATQSLVRWAGLATELGGLVGLGGLWGLDRLASGVGANRRTNQGLGLNQGERAAFGLNYGRITDPNAFLGDVNQALHDPAQVSRLFAAGLNPYQMSGDTAQTAVALMDRYRALGQQQSLADPSGRTDAAVLRAHGGLMSLEDFERLKSMSDSEYGGIRDNYNTDKGKMNLADPLMKKWQDFDVQLSRAGTNIKNAFITGLTPLIPQFDHLSKVVTDLLTHFLAWADKSGAIDKLAGGIEWLADTLADPKNQEKMKNGVLTFVGDIEAVATWMHDKLKALGIVKDQYKQGGALGVLQGQTAGMADEIKTDRLVRGLLPSIAQVESNNGDPRYMVSKEGALGKYQLMPATAKQYGVTNPMNNDQNEHGAILFLGDLAKKYGNDVPKMLAAYNWGPGNLDKDISTYGADWYKHLPKETADYERKVLRNRDAFMAAARAPGANSAAVRVEIYNFTGSDVVTTAGQIAK